MTTSNSNGSLYSGYTWLSVYFVLNLGLTLYNKIILNNFNFPYSVTAIHTLCGTIGCGVLYLFGVFVPAELGNRENLIMIAFSVLYTINIAISNVSLSLVSVPFHQMVRATTPVFTVILSIVFLKKSYPRMIYLSLLPVVLGVAFATCDEYTFTYVGFVLTVLGAFLASVKTIVTNRVQVGRLKLSPLDLLFRMSPLAFAQCIVYAYTSGELGRVYEFASSGENNINTSLVCSLALNGLIAFALNIVSFTANKKTSALTMTVAGNVKQVLSIILSVLIFDYVITGMNAFGILLTLAGGAWYGHVELSLKQHILPFVDETSGNQKYEKLESRSFDSFDSTASDFSKEKYQVVV